MPDDDEELNLDAEIDAESENVLDGNDSNETTQTLQPYSIKSLNKSINSYNTEIDKLCEFKEPFLYDENIVNTKIEQIKNVYEVPLKKQIEQIISSKNVPISDVQNTLKDFRKKLKTTLDQITQYTYIIPCKQKKKGLLIDIISYIEKQITECNSLLYIVSIGEYKSNDYGFNVSVYENLDNPSVLSETITATANTVIETVEPKYKYFITVGKMKPITKGAMAFGKDKDELIQNALDIFDNKVPKDLGILYFPYNQIKNMRLGKEDEFQVLNVVEFRTIKQPPQRQGFV